MAAKKPAAKAAAKKGNKTTQANTSATSKEKSLNELVGALAEKAGVTKVQAKSILEAHAELLIEELKQNGSVQLAGIGKLKLGERAERQGRNPSTGEAITIKAAKTVKFAGGKKFKDSFNG
jgi:DNA-binding protein HU-beta